MFEDFLRPLLGPLLLGGKPIQPGVEVSNKQGGTPEIPVTKPGSTIPGRQDVQADWIGPDWRGRAWSVIETRFKGWWWRNCPGGAIPQSQGIVISHYNQIIAEDGPVNVGAMQTSVVTPWVFRPPSVTDNVV